MRTQHQPLGRLDASDVAYLHRQLSQFEATARGEIVVRGDGSRSDANETAFLQRELLALDPTQYQELFGALLGRRYVPLITGIPEHKMAYSYKMWTVVGKAKKGTAQGTTHQSFKVTVKEKPSSIVAIPGMIEYTVDEIKAAAAENVPLEPMTMVAAHSGLESVVDGMLASGDADIGAEGLLNASGVNTTTATTKVAGGLTWAVATPAEILADIFKMLGELLDALSQATADGGLAPPTFTRFVVLVPVKQHTLLLKPRSDNSDSSIKKWLLDNLAEHIDAIEPWYKCKGAGAGATDRCVMYARNLQALGTVINQEFSTLAPQAVGHKIQIPCQMKCGGVSWKYKVAARYMDGI